MLLFYYIKIAIDINTIKPIIIILIHPDKKKIQPQPPGPSSFNIIIMSNINISNNIVFISTLTN